MIQIRALHEDDFSDLIALSRDFFQEYAAHHDDFFQIGQLSDGYIVDYFSRWIEDDCLLLFAENGYAVFELNYDRQSRFSIHQEGDLK